MDVEVITSGAKFREMVCFLEMPCWLWACPGASEGDILSINFFYRENLGKMLLFM
jgi:hypothetical protein